MNKLKYILLPILFMLAGAMLSSAQEKFSRNLESVNFIPKGQWIAGVSMNYSQSNQNNCQFLIIEGMDGEVYSFKITPTLLYSCKDNMAAGVKFGYSRSRSNLDKAEIVIDSETDYTAENFYMISQDYSAMGVYRYYFSLGHSKRFGMFAEAQLDLGFGQSKLRNGSGDDFTGSFMDNFSLGIGVAPGLIMFLNNYSAIEVNVGVLGFNYNSSKQKNDQIYLSKTHSTNANFKINIFSISFGVLFYL